MYFSNSVNIHNSEHNLESEYKASETINKSLNHSSKLENQPEAILQNVLGPFLAPKEVVRLSRTSKHFYSILRKNLIDAEITTMLTHVVRGSFRAVQRLVSY
jgi:hypothetical protein